MGQELDVLAATPDCWASLVFLKKLFGGLPLQKNRSKGMLILNANQV